MHPPGPASRTGKCSVAIRSKVAGAVAAAQQQRSGKRQRGGRNHTPGYSRNRTPECRGQKPSFGKWGGVPPESTRIPQRKRAVQEPGRGLSQEHNIPPFRNRTFVPEDIYPDSGIHGARTQGPCSRPL